MWIASTFVRLTSLETHCDHPKALCILLALSKAHFRFRTHPLVARKPMAMSASQQEVSLSSQAHEKSRVHAA